MKTNRQIQNLIVYVVLYVIIFGISAWLLIVDNESPTNWILYVAMIGSALAGVIKFGLHTWKQRRST